jgi:hypothetical protein
MLCKKRVGKNDEKGERLLQKKRMRSKDNP